jgi:hypothetical protein
MRLLVNASAIAVLAENKKGFPEYIKVIFSHKKSHPRVADLS